MSVGADSRSLADLTALSTLLSGNRASDVSVINATPDDLRAAWDALHRWRDPIVEPEGE